MNKQVNAFLIVLLFLSCSQQKNKRNASVFMPGAVASEGYTVPADSITEPVTIIAGKPKVHKAGLPQEIRSASRLIPAGKPNIFPVNFPNPCTPGEDGFPFPREIHSTAQPALSGIPQTVVAKSPSGKDVNPYSFMAFGTMQGLKHDQVRCILQDRQGNLWFSNEDGVTRFDGSVFTHFSVRTGLSANIVLCMTEDREGTMWFGTFGGGVTRFDGKYFTHYTEKEGLSNNIVNHIIQDKNGNYWFATSGGGVSKFDGNKFTHYTENEGLGSNQVRSIIEDKDGSLWFATYGNGISRFDGKSFMNFTPHEGFPATYVASTFRDKEGNIWFGSFLEGAIKYDGRYFYQYSGEQGLSYVSVLCMVQDNEGSIWFGTLGGGISKFDGRNFIHFTENEGLTNNRIHCSLIDKQGNLWFGTRDGGLLKYNDALFSHYTKNDGLGDSKVMSIIIDRKGNYWFGTLIHGITKYDGQIFSCYNFKGGRLNHWIYDIQEDAEGNIWITTENGGIIRFDGENLYNYTQEEGLCSNVTRCIIHDRKGNLWIGSFGKGVSKFDGRRFVNYSTRSGLSSNRVLCMLEDRHGAVWFGTDGGGVTRYDGKTFTHFTKKEGLSHNSVSSILEDTDGNIWFGTLGGGAIRYDGKYLTTFSEKDGLTNNFIHSMLQDKNGNIWMGTRLGPNILEKKKLLQKSQQPEIPLFSNYSYEDGFLGIGCNQGAICQDRKGIIWIGSTSRLTSIRPEKEIPDTVAPNIQLTNIQLFNENIPWIELENRKDTGFMLNNGVKVKKLYFSNISKWNFLPENLSLAYNNNFLTFSFSGISHEQAPKIKYQYLLAGQERNWSSLTNDTKVSYGSIAPGNYVFKVKAMNTQGIWSNELHYPFTVRPPWWKSLWAYIVLAIGSVTLIYYYINRRERKLEQQKHLLERKVKEQTAELKGKNKELQIKNSEKDKLFSIVSHDLRGPLSSFIGLTEHITENMDEWSPTEIFTTVQSMKSEATNLLELLNNLLEWARMQRGLTVVQPEKLILKDVIEESIETTRQAAVKKSISVIINIHPDIKIFTDKNMFGAVIRNLSSNAVKFTPRGGCITICAEQADKHVVEVSVNDTGIGMKKQMLNNLFRIDKNISRPGTEGEPSSGLGLLLCKEFIEKQGGHIRAESEEGKGSTFHFTVRSQ
ncbi:MAG: two-component regulator propeller domain-containing protein [Prolixibacteraceae bacterium]|jgi:ligand-binding sensor domain-containing protein/signal transduction histidine kinase|nr:two-component regulator propeller domain-containing protein [Prolixibacteraceae bacterium]